LVYEEAFTISITDVNDLPTISAIADASGDEDTALGPYNFTVGDAETAAGSLTVTALSSDTALVPVANVVLGGSGASRTVTITPVANKSGTATITIKLNDGTDEVSEVFDVTFNPVNDLPVFAKGADQSYPLTVTALQTIPGWATGIDDGDADYTQSLSFNVSVTSGAGIFSTLPAISSNGTLTYALTGVGGTAQVSVTLTDDASAGGAALTTAAQTFTISQVASQNANLASLAISAGSLTPAFNTNTTAYNVSLGNETSSITVTPTGGDTYSTIEVSVNGAPASAVTSGNPSGPLALNEGINTVVVSVKAQDNTTTKTYTLTVKRSPVIIVDQADIGIENDLLTKVLNVSGTPDGALVYTIATPPQHGTVEIDAAGNYFYRPARDFVGADSFTYDVADNSGDIGSATVTISVLRRPPHWSFEAGSVVAKTKGTYPGAVNGTGTPGARGNMASWSDGAGSLYIFGGTGFGSATGPGALNDFWRCDLTNPTPTWTWLGGSNTIDTAGTYPGSLGGTGTPGARAGAAAWTDASGTLWMFGGVSKTGPLNDLWKYSGGVWTWVKGSNTVKANGTYGTLGVTQPNNTPGARSGAATWVDSTGKLYLFGGNGLAKTGTAIGLLNDLWRFDPVSERWTWLGGSDAAKAPGVYGTKGIAAAANIPSARAAASATTGRDGMAYLFGGSNNNDLWRYDATTNTWVWLSGSNKTGAKGVYVTRSVPDSISEPAAREGAQAWAGPEGEIFIFGGTGHRDDVWSYQPATRQWTWVKGSSATNAAPVYGALHIGDEPNTPGARQLTAIALDARGDVWSFGGLNGANSFNDLFKLDQPTAMELNTLAATAVLDTTATLNATVNPNEFTTSAYLRFGKLIDFSDATTTAVTLVGKGTSAVALPENISGLATGTTYYYQVIGTNAFGTRTGSIRSFTTNGAAPASTVQFVSAGSSVSEKIGAVSVLVTLSAPSATTVTVPVALSNSATPVNLNFFPGQTSATLNVPVVDDNLVNPGQSIVLTFGTLTGGITAAGITSYTLTIQDDDQAIAIVAPLLEDQFIAAKDTLVLKVNATGSALKYQWMKDFKKIAGATSATYTLHNADLKAAGVYSCDVSNAFDIESSASIKVFVVDTTPKVTVTAPSKPVTFTVNAAGPAGALLTYVWKKDGGATVGVNSKTLTLPPVSTGDSGTYVCTVSSPGTVAIQSRNGGDNVLRVIAGLTYPATVIGSYLGLVERDSLVGGNLGGRLDLTTTSAGSFTAKLTADGVAASVTSNLRPTLAGSTITAISGQADFVRKGLATLRLDFTLNLTNNTLSGTLTDISSGETAALSGYRNTWIKTTNEANSYKGYYTFGLEIPNRLAGDLEIPQGNGYGAFTVTGPDGKLSVVGATADGQTYTSAGFVGPSGQVGVFAAFKTPGGSILGTGTINPAAPTFVNNSFTGTLSWNRLAELPASKGVTYRSGFGPIDLAILGGKYKAQAAGGIVMNLTNAANKARLVFAEGGLSNADLDGTDANTDADNFVFSIQNTGTGVAQKITLPAATDTLLNYNKTTFTLPASPQGLFSGGFTVPNANKALVRASKFFGIIVWTGSAYSAQGYFLIAQPPQSGQTVATSPVLSGQVILEANP
jgi:hypothetical protein